MDITLRNGLLFDGEQLTAYPVSVGIEGAKIAAIVAGSHDLGGEMVDVSDHIISPGFIDMHSHSGLVALENRLLAPKVTQGITTELIGQDGISVAPVTDQTLNHRQHYLESLDGRIAADWTWRSFDDYLQTLAATPANVNFAPLAPAGAIRDVVIGNVRRPASPDELQTMVALVHEAMAAGAFGLSYGLIYVPGSYATSEEIEQLAAAAGHYNGVVVAHIRNEADDIVPALDEILTLGQRYQTPVHISHLKIMGHQNAHLVHDVLARFRHFENLGVQVSFDQYPYPAGSTLLAAILPMWALAGDVADVLARLKDAAMRQRLKQEMIQGLPGWENIFACCGWRNITITYAREGAYQDVVGKNIAAISQARGIDPFDFTFDLLHDNALRVGMMDKYCDEAVVRQIMSSPYHTLGSDGVFTNNQHNHPRLYGSFPRFIGKYVLQDQVTDLAEGLRRLTSSPAQVLGLRERGFIREGYFADIAVIAPQHIMDHATYQKPTAFSTGVTHVLVNGQFTVRDGRVRDAFSGRVFRR